MRRTLIIALVVVAAAAAIAFSSYHILSGATIVPHVGGQESSPETAWSGEPLVQTYTSSTYRFSVSMPADFKTAELPADENGARTILLQNDKGEGIQIMITPYPNDPHIITADDVRASIPGMKVTDEQPVVIGSDYTGVAFKSDNDAFGGDSREVWFVFRKNLYQISTYGRLDPLLKDMFATWKFF